MDEETTAQLRGLLESVSDSASHSGVLLQSRRLRQALRSTRIWAIVLLVLSICFLGLILLASLWEIMQWGNRASYFWIVPLIIGVAVSVPLAFVGIYCFRLHDFLRSQQPERFLRMMVAQRWMWTVLGIYAAFFTALIALLLTITVGIRLF